MGLGIAMTDTATSELDPKTSDALRKALASAQRGEITDACRIAEKALGDGGDVVALNALLGMLQSRAGDLDAAIRHLRIAHEARPTDVRILSNLAAALISKSEFQSALEVLTAELASNDPSQHLIRIRGYAAQMAGAPDIAADAYRKVVAVEADDWESWNNLGNALLATDDVDGGIAALRRAVGLYPSSPPTRLNLARAVRRSGDLQEAERQLRSMMEDFPGDLMPVMDLFALLKEAGRPDEEVMKVLRKAGEIDPDNLDVLLASGRQLTLLLDLDEAEAFFRRAMAIDGASIDAFIGLATIYDLHRPGDLDSLVSEASEAGLDPAAFSFVSAFAHRRAKRFSEGLAALEGVPEEFESLRRAEFLGQFHEGVGDYDEAFAAYARMNEIQAGKESQPLARAQALRLRLAEQLDQMSAEWVSSWKDTPDGADGQSPVFLVGFPRSGTTLLDTMLMGHPDVVVMEERPALSDVEKAIGGFHRIPQLRNDELTAARAAYFSAASQYIQLKEGGLLVDKSPLNLNMVPLIHRVFPNARFILVLRHPFDSVFSCFASNFRLNSSMSNFLTLETAAQFYDLTFSLWEKSRALLPINVQTVRYEELVADPERELKQLADFLGLRWNKAMLDHRDTAAKRGLIATASYAQVTEPIYARSVGRSRNFEKYLAPVAPILSPWVEKLGYKSWP